HLAVFHVLKTAPEKKKRLATLTKYMDSTEPHVRLEAIQAIGHIGDEAKEEIPVLLKHLNKDHNEKDYVAMGWCMWALGRMEKAALAAVPQLEKIAADESVPEAFRDTAKEAIDSIRMTKREEPKKKGGEKK